MVVLAGSDDVGWDWDRKEGGWCIIISSLIFTKNY